VHGRLDHISFRNLSAAPLILLIDRELDHIHSCRETVSHVVRAYGRLLHGEISFSETACLRSRVSCGTNKARTGRYRCRRSGRPGWWRAQPSVSSQPLTRDGRACLCSSTYSALAAGGPDRPDATPRMVGDLDITRDVTPS
jgi:hypothetical protein